MLQTYIPRSSRYGIIDKYATSLSRPLGPKPNGYGSDFLEPLSRSRFDSKEESRLLTKYEWHVARSNQSSESTTVLGSILWNFKREFFEILLITSCTPMMLTWSMRPMAIFWCKCYDSFPAANIWRENVFYRRKWGNH